MNNIDRQKLLNSIISASNGKIDKNSLNRAQNGDISALTANLSEQDRQKLNEALNNPEKAHRILSSAAAKQLLSGLFGSGKNGHS